MTNSVTILSVIVIAAVSGAVGCGGAAPDGGSLPRDLAATSSSDSSVDMALSKDQAADDLANQGGVLTRISVSPASASIAVSGTQMFLATAMDQSGNTLSVQPTISWSASGGGQISQAGLFTASATAGGPFTITAKASSVSATATVTTHQPVGGCSSSAGLNVWQNITPPPLASASVFAFVIDPNHPGTVYLGTTNAGIWKTTDCGATWSASAINTGTTGTDVNDPTGPAVPGSILNDGRNWSMVIDPTNSNLYTVDGYGSNGFYESTDGGVNWSQILPSSIRAITENGFINHVSLDPTDHTHLVMDFHVAGCTGPALPGAQVVDNDLKTASIVSLTQSTPTGSGTNYAGWGCLAETHDSGKTWTLTTAGFPDIDGDGPGIQIVNDKTWYFGTQGGSLWRTTTGGVVVNGAPAWTKLDIYVSSCDANSFPMPVDCVCAGSVCSEPIQGGLGFVYIAQDGSFYSGGNYGVMHSVDGVHWSSISAAYAPGLYDYNGSSPIVDTGTTLYVAQTGTTNNYYTASIKAIESDTGTAPATLLQQLPANSSMTQSGVQLQYDPVNHIVYSENRNGGFWRLNTQ